MARNIASTILTLLSRRRFLRRCALAAVACAAAWFCTAGGGAQAQEARHVMAIREIDRNPEYRLGERLFLETRMSNPGSQFLASCSSCHLLQNSKGRRAYADSQPRSLLPATSRGPKKTTIRNTPTLYDVSRMPRLNADGEHESLAALIRAKLTGRHMGWLPGEEAQARSDLFALLLNDIGEDKIAEGSYIEQFKAARHVDLESLSQDEALDQVVGALSDYLSQVGMHTTAPYDAFAYLNRLNTAIDIEAGDDADAYAGRIFGRLANQEGRVLVKWPAGYDELAYQGYKIFTRTYDVDYVDRIGNCISCHPPPYFTDNSFHNTGTAQEEYDALHGEGAFAKLNAAGAGASRPSQRFRARPAADKPGQADLGYWNFVDVKNSPLRDEGESDDAFLGRMAGAFKTPTLRNLDYSGPYMHNGAYRTLEEVVAHKVRMSQWARKGNIENIDPQYLRMKLTEQDIAPLAAFLRTLNEEKTDLFRESVLRKVVIRGTVPEGSFPGTLDSEN